MNQNKENTRLTKNTLALFFRMLISLVVGLYTSRIILKELGVSDYGLFNVIGGMVSMFSFVCTSLAGGTQRFLNYALGSGVESEVTKTFRTTLTIHMVLSVLVFLIVAFIGYYLVSYQLNIPQGRQLAAIYVLIFCLLSICTDVIKVPFDAAIIAHEHMNFYAFLSIFDASIKLCIVYLLSVFTEIDKLILYSFLYWCTSVLLLVIYYLYCKKEFYECKRIRIQIVRDKIKEIGKYVSWALIGNLTFMLSTQGINILFNIFGDTTINAARGLSVQIGGTITKFTANITTATNPQIVKRYAADDLDSMFTLVKNVSKYTGILMLLLLTPLILEIDNILELWLGNVPPHTSWFSIVMLIQSFFTAISLSSHCAIVATGKIKNVQICTGLIQFIYVVLSYICLKLGFGVDLVMSLYILPSIGLFIVYIYYIKKYTGLKIYSYINDVISKLLIVFIISTPIPYYLHISLENTIYRFGSILIVNAICIIGCTLAFVIDKKTLRTIINYINK